MALSRSVAVRKCLHRPACSVHLLQGDIVFVTSVGPELERARFGMSHQGTVCKLTGELFISVLPDTAVQIGILKARPKPAVCDEIAFCPSSVITHLEYLEIPQSLPFSCIHNGNFHFSRSLVIFRSLHLSRLLPTRAQDAEAWSPLHVSSPAKRLFVWVSWGKLCSRPSFSSG